HRLTHTHKQHRHKQHTHTHARTHTYTGTRTQTYPPPGRNSMPLPLKEINPIPGWCESIYEILILPASFLLNYLQEAGDISWKIMMMHLDERSADHYIFIKIECMPLNNFRTSNICQSYSKIRSSYRRWRRWQR